MQQNVKYQFFTVAKEPVTIITLLYICPSVYLEKFASTKVLEPFKWPDCRLEYVQPLLSVM